MIWEIVYKRRPFEGLEALQIMYKVAIKRETLELDTKTCDSKLVEIIQSCWIYDHNKRSSIGEVRKQIKGLTNQMVY